MKYLFSDWQKIVFRIKKSGQVILFFDYDGTLTPIVSRPELAKIPSEEKILLKKLQKHPKAIVAIISGRSLKDVKRMVGIKGLIYAGNHGMEIQGKGLHLSGIVTVKKFRTVLNNIHKALSEELKHIKGVIVEHKGATLSIHYRLVNLRPKAKVKSIVLNITKPFISKGKIKITRGKEVLEVRPNLEWHKGKAVTLILKKYKNALPVYTGDDVTDMDAFLALKNKGISIFVGRPKGNIKADYFLKNTKEVGRFIRKLTYL